MLKIVAAAVLVCQGLVLAASDEDLNRAITTCPRAGFKGQETLGDANKVLNVHLENMEHLKTRACETFSASTLQKISAALYGVADPALLDVYAKADDNRKQVYSSTTEMHADFERLNGLVQQRADLHDVLRDGLCHRVVMWFIHHLPVAKQHELAHAGIVMPLLPAKDHSEKSGLGAKADDDETTKAVHKEYEGMVTCQACHVGGIPDLGVPEVKPVTPAQLARRCYTNYKDLFGIECGPCDGIAGKYWGDNDDKAFTPEPCVVVGKPEDIPEKDRVPSDFPPVFSVDVVAGSDRWGRTTNPAGHVKTPFPPVIDSMYGQISGRWFADISPDSDLWLLRHDTKYNDVSFNGTKTPLSFSVSEIHSQTKLQQSQNNSGCMVSLIDGIPDFIPGGCTCVEDPVGVPDVHHERTKGLDQMQYMGRINISLIEVDAKNPPVYTVDHWANWFFHVFMNVDKTDPAFGKAPRRLASAYAGTATYDNWKFEDPKIADPTVWFRGIPKHPEKVGPDHGKFCMNPQNISMCDNISEDTFPPKPEGVRSTTTPWRTLHRTFFASPEFAAAERARDQSL